MMSATERWASELESWALPDELLDAVDESPHGWPPELWKRRSRQSLAEPPALTTGIVESLSPDGPVLDVGAGRGRASLPLAGGGRQILMVEPDEGMRAGIEEERGDIDVEVIAGRWPDVAREVPRVSVSMCAHVVYDVADIGPFVAALHATADDGVAIEMTPSHPWSVLTPYFAALHGLSRPDGPTWHDMVEVVEEVVGVTPADEQWTRPGGVWFESRDELVAFQGQRLLVGPDRREELEELLGPDIDQEDGRFRLSPKDRRLVTLWWRTG